MSTGVVVFVSRNKGMLVVQHEQGFSVVEMLGREGEIASGHQLSGEWLSLGGGNFTRASDSFRAYFQGCWANKNAAIGVASRTGGG